MSNDLDLRAVHQHHEPDPEFRAALRGRVARIVSPDGSERGESERGGPESPVVDAMESELGRRRTRQRRRRSAILVATAAAAVIAIAVATIPADESTVSTPGLGTSGDGAFASAIETSGLLTSPSADEVEQATDGALYRKDTGPTEVSAGRYVSLRTCRQRDAACSNGWAYITGSVDGSKAAMHRGLLRATGPLAVHLIDDRFFVVVSKNFSNAEVPSAWLIDAVSGKAGPLRWRDDPTTLASPEQALLLLCRQSIDWRCSNGEYTPMQAVAGLPRVVDARDGTIRPMSMPDNLVARFPVAQRGAGRVWVGTGPEGGPLGLVSSDDGGATWTEVALPEPLRGRSDDLVIAADGDRVAAASGWVPEGKPVYVSDDAGRSWTPATAPSEPLDGNLEHLYVLADGRLVFVASIDSHASQVFVSSGADWAALEEVEVLAPRGFAYFTVNRAGIAVGDPESFSCPGVETTTSYGEVVTGDAVDCTQFSTDLTDWWTIEGLDG